MGCLGEILGEILGVALGCGRGFDKPIDSWRWVKCVIIFVYIKKYINM
jgi:hypothetical protein